MTDTKLVNLGVIFFKRECDTDMNAMVPVFSVESDLHEGSNQTEANPIAIVIIIATVALIGALVVVCLTFINRRRRATKGHITIVQQVEVKDPSKPGAEVDNSVVDSMLQSNDNDLPLVQQNAQYASEDIENPNDKARRRVYFRNVLEDAGRHEFR